MLSYKDVAEINKSFSNGRVINQSSLEFAVKTSARSKNWLRTAAIFTRSILIDHVFEDGNKRTAAAVILDLMDLNNVQFKAEEIPKIIIIILRKNINNITQIERCIKDAVR